MSASEEVITLRELLQAYLESKRPQVNPIMTRHTEQVFEAYEAALKVRVPRSNADFPPGIRALSFVWFGTIESILNLQTPLAGALEAGLVVSKLESAGPDGAAVIEGIRAAADTARQLRVAEVEILRRLLRICLAGADPSATMEEVRATGIYPGRTPKDFDIFDHM